MFGLLCACAFLQLNAAHGDCAPLLGFHVSRSLHCQVKMLMDLVCSSCGELMEDAVKKNMRIRVLASDATKVGSTVALSLLDSGYLLRVLWRQVSEGKPVYWSRKCGFVYGCVALANECIQSE